MYIDDDSKQSKNVDFFKPFWTKGPRCWKIPGLEWRWRRLGGYKCWVARRFFGLRGANSRGWHIAGESRACLNHLTSSSPRSSPWSKHSCANDLWRKGFLERPGSNGGKQEREKEEVKSQPQLDSARGSSINYTSRFVQLQGEGVGLLYTCASQSLAVGSFVGQGRGSCNAHGGRHSISSRARKTWGDGDTKCQWKWYEGFWCRTNIVHLGRENNFKGTFLDILMEVLCTPKYCCDIPLLSYSPEEGTVPSKSVTS